MLRALTLYPWLNTAEDEKRRVAVRWVLTHWKEYQDECARRREALPSRTGRQVFDHDRGEPCGRLPRHRRERRSRHHSTGRMGEKPTHAIFSICRTAAAGAYSANVQRLQKRSAPAIAVRRGRVTNRTDCSGSEDRMAPAAATGASPHARPCFAPRSKASNTGPQGRRNR